MGSWHLGAFLACALLGLLSRGFDIAQSRSYLNTSGTKVGVTYTLRGQGYEGLYLTTDCWGEADQERVPNDKDSNPPQKMARHSLGNTPSCLTELRLVTVEKPYKTFTQRLT